MVNAQALLTGQATAPGQGIPATLAGHGLLLLPEGAVFMPETRTLVVADLHLGKGLAFAARGQMLPPYDSRDTLDRLQKVVAAWQPERLILLGDSLHRQSLESETLAPVASQLAALARQTALIWITGNHDPAPAEVPGQVQPEFRFAPALVLRHEPMADGLPEMIGHLHPAARLPTRAGRQRRRCFVLSRHRLLLPAFGALTGTICVSDPLITRWFPEREGRVFLMLGHGLAELPLAAVTG